VRRRTSEPARLALNAIGILLALGLLVAGVAAFLPRSAASGAGTLGWQSAEHGAFPGSAPSLEAYTGLASWVDIFDHRAWAHPEAAVADMASHGVHTLFIETGNSSSARGAIFDPPAQARFIRAAHAHGMRIVAWYLPDMARVGYDFSRISRAIAFKTSDGQTFDSFALDIESAAVKPEARRDRALGDLSSRIRRLVGGSYPLGAIVPPPVGIAKRVGYWNGFPYGSVATVYDVILPMGYYTYHGHTAAAAAADARGNVRILRAERGCRTIPIHLIGGLAHGSSPAEVRAFANAAVSGGCIGVSLYSWADTTASQWRALQVAR
jgi:hypothetical protein